ncbi:MAG: hypothetical protein HFI02_04690 [Lachnospiraceae bacterium]|jgi:hypothetical protein|nr:hypothetical protein [Lachnospiraceae bacterium]
MLKKLFKYEWVFFWKVPTAINVFLIIVTIVGVISLASPFWELNLWGIDVLLGLAIFFYIMAIFACSIAVTVYVAVRYYKNIYTDEGYLTNTLPVTARQIVLSKLFTGLIWTLLTGIVVSISVLSLVYTAFYASDSGFWADVMRDFPDFLAIFREEMGISFSFYLLLLLIQTVLSSAFSILKIYTAIALGQLFTKHKVAGAFLWYVGEFIIFQIISSITTNASPLSGGVFGYAFGVSYYNYSRLGDIIIPSTLISIATTLIFSAVLYFITEHMLKNQLNLD